MTERARVVLKGDAHNQSTVRVFYQPVRKNGINTLCTCHQSVPERLYGASFHRRQLYFIQVYPGRCHHETDSSGPPYSPIFHGDPRRPPPRCARRGPPGAPERRYLRETWAQGHKHHCRNKRDEHSRQAQRQWSP
ncbi:hypothetical protein N657DRAFT_672654, partial [Parathielavia appendiculata]